MMRMGSSAPLPTINSGLQPSEMRREQQGKTTTLFFQKSHHEGLLVSDPQQTITTSLARVA